VDFVSICDSLRGERLCRQEEEDYWKGSKGLGVGPTSARQKTLQDPVSAIGGGPGKPNQHHEHPHIQSDRIEYRPERRFDLEFKNSLDSRGIGPFR